MSSRSHFHENLKAWTLVPLAPLLPRGEGGCPGAPPGPSAWDGCGPLTCVLGNGFLLLESRDHPGAEAWVFFSCRLLRTSQGRAAVLGSLLCQARSQALQAQPPWPASSAETTGLHPSEAPPVGFGTLPPTPCQSHWALVEPGSPYPRAVAQVIPLPGAGLHQELQERWHCHLGQAWGVRGAGCCPGACVRWHPAHTFLPSPVVLTSTDVSCP